MKNINKYADFIMARVLKQEAMERIGGAATIPAINGMTEVYHPCQTMADLLTVREHKGKLRGVRIVYVGDGGCNTANSTMIGCSSAGMDVTVVCPDDQKYSPAGWVLKTVKEHTGKAVKVSHDPAKGVAGADVVYTDVWVSAGMEAENEVRMRAFKPYQVNAELVAKAKGDCIVMHCLPAHRGYEITSEVMDSPQSVVFDQAGNRMHAQKGLLVWLMETVD